MKKNMGLVDSIIRLVLAAMLATLYFAEIVVDVWGIVLLVVSAILVLTSFIGFCPIYMLLGISSCSGKKKKE